VINRVKELIGMSSKPGTAAHSDVSLAHAASAFESEVGPEPPPAPTAAPSAPAAHEAQESWVADAFTALFAEEQGEARTLVLGGPPRELSDAEIDRIAARVAEKLTQGPLAPAVSRIVTEVSERLVREEIERIRGLAQGRPA
jgi:hypothetical protein